MDGRLKIQIAGITDVGQKRSHNEDTFFCGTVWDDNHVLAIVIDGCGGHKGGAEAARLTQVGMLQYLNGQVPGDSGLLLKKALVHANNLVHGRRKEVRSLCEMCCVATAVIVDLDTRTLHMVHVGDTRLYASYDGRIIKLSHDHSPIGREEEMGIFTEIQAMNHPCRNIIERAVGLRELDDDTSYIEQGRFTIAAGLTWLLCSDGLSDMCTSAQISDILREDRPLPQIAWQLVEAANEEGGKDNITVAILRAEGKAPSDAPEVMNSYARMLDPQWKPDIRPVKRQKMRPECGATPQLTPIEGQEVCKEEASFKHIEAIVKPARHKTGLSTRKIVGYVLFWLLLAVALVFGIRTYQVQKQRRIEEEKRQIRQEIFHRNLYYNIDNIIRPKQQAEQPSK